MVSYVFPFNHNTFKSQILDPIRDPQIETGNRKLLHFIGYQLSMHQNVYGISWVYISHRLTCNFLVLWGMVPLFLLGRWWQSMNDLFFPLCIPMSKFYLSKTFFSYTFLFVSTWGISVSRNSLRNCGAMKNTDLESKFLNSNSGFIAYWKLFLMKTPNIFKSYLVSSNTKRKFNIYSPNICYEG